MPSVLAVNSSTFKSIGIWSTRLWLGIFCAFYLLFGFGLLEYDNLILALNCPTEDIPSVCYYWSRISRFSSYIRGKRTCSSSFVTLEMTGVSFRVVYFSIFKLLLLDFLLFSSQSDCWSPGSIEILLRMKWKVGSDDSRRPTVSSFM